MGKEGRQWGGERMVLASHWQIERWQGMLGEYMRMDTVIFYPGGARGNGVSPTWLSEARSTR